MLGGEEPLLGVDSEEPHDDAEARCSEASEAEFFTAAPAPPPPSSPTKPPPAASPAAAAEPAAASPPAAAAAPPAAAEADGAAQKRKRSGREVSPSAPVAADDTVAPKARARGKPGRGVAPKAVESADISEKPFGTFLSSIVSGRGAEPRLADRLDYMQRLLDHVWVASQCKPCGRDFSIVARRPTKYKTRSSGTEPAETCALKGRCSEVYTLFKHSPFCTRPASCEHSHRGCGLLGDLCRHYKKCVVEECPVCLTTRRRVFCAIREQRNSLHPGET
ncbi:hypothetical protein M885DRAFT_234450 [Pelagophyceae sp. CCMP2097]|nr:hypothetical protein M885DRAFT_234450 [Pelagophyceae sp. CCMP2097]